VNKNPGIAKVKKVCSHLPMIAALEMGSIPGNRGGNGQALEGLQGVGSGSPFPGAARRVFGRAGD
jgi:hypothetical protein